jgi:Putative threonine/serine exporter
VRDARATGPRSAIDQFEKGNTLPRAADVRGAAASRFQLSVATALVSFCPCMVLVPGPHILNGAIDLARTRIALGIARLTYAGVIVLLICAGLLFGFAAVGAKLAIGLILPRMLFERVLPAPA